MESRRPRIAVVAVVAAMALVAVLGCRGEGAAPAPPPGPFAVPAVARAAQAGRPVLFVGWDGADWQLLDRYGAEGAMPNLAALVREGRSGVLRTIQPPLSPLVWTTMMTGVSPLVNGILDFTRFSPRSGEREPITRAERRVPAVWNMAGMAGRSAAVFGLWATWPAEPVDGLLVSDRLFAFQNPEAAPPPGVVYPPAEEAWARGVLAETEREVGFSAVHAYLPWLAENEYRLLLAQPDPYTQPAAALRRILVETAVYDRLAKEWLARHRRHRRHRPDLTIVYFQGSDAIGHVFAPYAPPRLPAVSAADFTRYSAVPRLYFADLDRRLGEYRKIAERQGAVLVLASDHGFRWGEGRPERLASAAAATAGRWHREEGIYLLWGSGIAATPEGGHPEHGSVTQVAATLLSLLGLPPGEGLAGPPLPGTPPSLAATPVRPLRYTAWFHPAPPAAVSSGGSEEVAKLKALGYVGAKEPARALAPGDDPTRTAGSYDNEGLLLRGEGRTAEARAAFEKALARDPENAAALANLSDLLAQSITPAERDRSDALLGKALTAGLPDGIERVLARIAALRRAGEAGRALSLLDRAIAARPEREEPRLLRGRLLLERQDCRGALADFTAAGATAPRDPLAWGSAALARLCLGDRAGAARDLRRSLALNPDQPEVARALAQIEGP
jgi:Flp pilus assembly protein TadD